MVHLHHLQRFQPPNTQVPLVGSLQFTRLCKIHSALQQLPLVLMLVLTLLPFVIPADISRGISLSVTSHPLHPLHHLDLTPILLNVAVSHCQISNMSVLHCEMTESSTGFFFPATGLVPACCLPSASHPPPESWQCPKKNKNSCRI